MQITYLKSTDKESMISALKEAGFLFDDGELITATHMTENSGYFISMIGELHVETGVILTDEDGNEYPEKEALAGYHANLVCNDASLLNGISSLTIDVNSPLTKICGVL